MFRCLRCNRASQVVVKLSINLLADFTFYSLPPKQLNCALCSENKAEVFEMASLNYLKI